MRVLLVTLTATVLSIMSVVTAYAADDASYAVLTKKVNSVKVLTTTSKHWEDADLNQKYRPGDMIRTEGDSSAQIDMSDGSVIKLFEYTQIMINPVEREIHLDIGKVFLKFVKGTKNPKVKTPTAVAAALGTMWVQEQNAAGTTEIHVLEHQVGLTSGGSLQVVNEGEFSSAASGQPPQSPQTFNISEYLKTEPVIQNIDIQKLKEEPLKASLVVPAPVPAVPVVPDASDSTAVAEKVSDTPVVVADTSESKKAQPVTYVTFKQEAGNAKVMLKGSNQWQDVEVGRKYVSGDVIRTNGGSTAKIELSNGVVIELPPSTKLTVSPDLYSKWKKHK